jgi:hypothetical protein
MHAWAAWKILGIHDTFSPDLRILLREGEKLLSLWKKMFYRSSFSPFVLVGL